MGSGKYAFSTVERRQRRIKYFSRHIDIREPDLNQIYNFVIEQQKSGKKRKSITEDMICLESWFKFLGKEVSLPRLKKEPPEPKILTDNEIQKIWDYIEHIHDR
jgi:site-specific recombinase XerD